MNIFRLISVAFFVVYVTSIAASEHQQLSISHPKFEQPLIFNVALPSSYNSKPEKRYIMLFDLHPHSKTYLSGMHDWMSHNGEWPWLETIVITADYGNPVGTLFDKTGKTTPILDFYQDHLFPQIDKTYRTNGYRIMTGFRVNGSLVLSALINKPDLVNAFIAISPELDDDLLGILSSAKQKLQAQDDKPRFLMFTHGSGVKEEHQLTAYSRLNDIIGEAAVANLDWHYQNLSQHYFMSLPLVSMILGIERLFDDIHQGLAADSVVSSKGVEAIIAHYDFLSTRKYGFEVSPKRSIRNLAQHRMSLDHKNGIATYQQLVERFPDDAYSYHELAAAYAKANQMQLAIETQKTAVSMSQDMLTWHKRKIQTAYDDYVSGSLNP